jgi:hypothetical protein
VKLNNPMRITVEAMGKRFVVVKVTRSLDEANDYCEANADCGLIASDEDGNHYLAEIEAVEGGAK